MEVFRKNKFFPYLLWNISVNILQMTVNERFKLIRNETGFTQEVFGESIGLKQSNITDIERGKAFPNFNIMEIVHKKFNVNLNWLICGTGKMKIENSSLDVLDESGSQYGNQNDLIECLQENRQLQKEIRSFIENCTCDAVKMAKSKQVS